MTGGEKGRTEKTGEVTGKVGKKGWGAVKGFGKDVKEVANKKKK